MKRHKEHINNKQKIRKSEKGKKCAKNNFKLRDPLPMKLRAFPNSFWQQPNKTLSISPGTVYSFPSPLTKEASTTVNDNGEELQRAVTTPNVDLLFSLFRNVDQEGQNEGRPRKLRRGRPRKARVFCKSTKDDDPYLTSSFTESIVPLLPKRGKDESMANKIAEKEKILGLISVNGFASNSPSEINSSNENYAQLLSQLVVQL